MFVIVTWGGTNDYYTGSAGGVSLSNIGYVEQSALASQYWEGQPGSHQIACKGNEVGHSWLRSINAWMLTALLSHPKGAANISNETLLLPSGASCSEEGATYIPPIVVECPSSSQVGCQQYCQMLGDCVAENGTLGPVLAEQLQAVGFADAANVCSGCVGQCERDATNSAIDNTVLGCLATNSPATTCGPGFAGAAAFSTLASCCRVASGSAICTRMCRSLDSNPTIASFFSVCS
jgi:hypothetical protein